MIIFNRFWGSNKSMFVIKIKKKKNLLFAYCLPRIYLTTKIIRTIAPIVTHITGIA